MDGAPKHLMTDWRNSSQHAGEPFAGVGEEICGDLFGGAFSDDLAAGCTAFGAEVDDPIGGLDDIEIVLDDNQRAATVDELAEGGEELGDIVEMEAGGGLVEDVKDAASLGRLGGGVDGANLGEVGGELDALRLAAGERGGRLTEAEVAEADLVEDGELFQQAVLAGEEAQRLLDGHLQDIVDVLALVVDVEDFGLITGAVAVLAGQFDVGEELHFYGDGAVALAGVAAAAGDVEGKMT